MRCTVLILLATIISAANIYAADFTFDGSTSNVWTVDSNWAGGSAPTQDVDGTIMIESGNGADPFTLTGIDLDYTNLDGLNTTAAGTDGTYTLDGTGSFTFNDGATIANNKTGTLTIDVDLVGTGNTLEINTASSLVLTNGDIDLSDSGGVNINLIGTNNTNFFGVISGEGGSITHSVGGNAFLTLNGSNTFTGGVRIESGRLQIFNDNALGTGTLTIANPLVVVRSNDNSRHIQNDIDILNSSSMSVRGLFDLEISGTISGDGVLARRGITTTLTLNGNNTYSGGTDFEQGTIVVGHDNAFGTGSVTVGSDNFLESSNDSISISNDFTLLDSGENLTIMGSNDLALTGVISGDGGLIKEGASTLLISGSNTFIGGTNLSDGTVVLGNDNALSSGTVTISGDASIASNDNSRSLNNAVSIGSGNLLTVNGSNDLALTGIISGGGDFIKDGAGTLLISGNNTFSGNATLSDGTIIAGNDNALSSGAIIVSGDAGIASNDDLRSLSNTISIGSGNSLTVNGSNNLELTGIISGDGSFGVDMATGTQSIALSGNNTFTSSSILSQGIIILGHDNALGTSDALVNGDVTIQSNDDLRSVSNAFNVNLSNTLTISGSDDLTLSGIISSDGSLTVDMATVNDVLTLNGNNIFTGGTVLDGGTVITGNDNAFGTGDVTVISTTELHSDEDARAISNDISLQSSLRIGGSNQLTLSGNISGINSITIRETSTLLLSGNNTYVSGTNLVNNATLILGNDNALGVGEIFTEDDVTLQSNDNSRSISNDITIIAGNMTISGTNDLALSGIVNGDGALTVNMGVGTEAITLSGTNTYSGGTTLTSGTLVLGNDDALGTGDVSVAGASSLQSDNDTRAISNNFTLNNNIDVVGSNQLTLSGIISGSGIVTVEDSATLLLSGNNTYTLGTGLQDSATLILGNDNALGTGIVGIDNNADVTLQSNNDVRSISNDVLLGSGSTTTINGSNDLTLAGVISLTGALAKSDSNTLTLSGTNTYTGGTTLSGGIIVLGNDDALGTGSLSITGDATIQPDTTSRTIGNDMSISSGNTLTVAGNRSLTMTGLISGTGGINVNNTTNASLNLNSNNTYTGGTTLSENGRAFVNADEALGTGTINAIGNSNLTTTSNIELSNATTISSGVRLGLSSNNSFNHAGVISGDGSLALLTIGGSITLSGSNTYTGGTEITLGTLNLANDNALGTGSLSITGDATLESDSDGRAISNDINIESGDTLSIEGAFNLALSGVISGDGDLNINLGSETIRLSGNNTYTGGTTVNGSVIVGHDNAFGTGDVVATPSTFLSASVDALTISNNIEIQTGATIFMGGTNSFALTGILSGDGGISIFPQTGATVTLSGNNTYAGGTAMLFNGVVVVGNDNAFGTGSISLSSTGGIFQSNDDARSVGNAIAISSGRILTVSGSNDMELTGVISGDGGVTKEGSSTLTLSNANNTFTGDTTVTAGTLIINGTMASGNVNVASGATLSGVMNFAGNFINSGTVSPGNSPGTMIVGGNLTLNSTSIYDMEIQSTAGPGTGNDFIDVTGTAAIDGTLNVIGLGGYSATDGDTFTILDADGGVSGTFATILDDIAGFEATATYNANDITVTLNAATADFANTVTARNLVFAAEAFTRIANNSPTGDMATVIAQLENQTGNNLVVAFEQIVPNYLVPQAEATFKGIDVQNNNFNGRFNELRNGLPKLWSNNLGVNTPDNASINDSADPEFAMMLAMQAQETLEQQQETARFTGAEKDIWGAWVNGFGTFGDYDSTSSQAGYNFNTGGVTFGFDYRVLDTLAAGAFVGYSNTGVTVDNGQGTNSFNSINTGMYMTWFNEEGFYASGLFGGGVNFYENNRRIRFGTVDRVAESDPTGFYLQTLATGGYEFKKGNWGFGPQLALQWVNLQIGSHSETGADSLNLNVGAFNGNSFVTRLGFRATYEYDTDAMLFVPELVGFWEHEYLDPINTVDVGVPAGGESFTYTGIGPGRDSGLIGVNLVGISHEAPVSFTLQYNVEFTPDDFIVNNVYAVLESASRPSFITKHTHYKSP
ncbi:autotransporter domain-containing protein [Poriferisphaera sp. WC338]|uniref:autotransporter domain-containing protein n=1 Tax=Poriferisphaera sp. WC338 TaxID=3425129 RepID=UPI003D817870